jgi:hypothetical protein
MDRFEVGDGEVEKIPIGRLIVFEQRQDGRTASEIMRPLLMTRKILISRPSLSAGSGSAS